MSSKYYLLTTCFIFGIALLLLFQNCSKVSLAPVSSLEYQKTVSIRVNYCPTTGYSYKNVFAFSRSAHLENDKWVADFDRDGLSDDYENTKSNSQKYNIGPKYADTNGDGYSDFVVNRIGYDQEAQKNLRTCTLINQDTDHDGLTDCEEAALKTDSLKFDTDGDGIPDYLELLYHLNPNDPNDAYQDNDLDGFTNLQEVQMNTPPDVSNTEYMNKRAIVYKVNQTQIEGKSCYSLIAQRLPIVNVGNGNMLQVMVVEKNSLGVDNLRMATVIVPANVQDGIRIVIDDLKYQTIDNITIPIVTEPDI